MGDMEKAKSSELAKGLAEARSLLADWNESNQVFLKLAQESEPLLDAKAVETKSATPSGKSKAKPKR